MFLRSFVSTTLLVAVSAPLFAQSAPVPMFVDSETQSVDSSTQKMSPATRGFMIGALAGGATLGTGAAIWCGKEGDGCDVIEAFLIGGGIGVVGGGLLGLVIGGIVGSTRRAVHDGPTVHVSSPPGLRKSALLIGWRLHLSAPAER